MAIDEGYNKKQAEEVMEKIVKGYQELGSTIENEWPSVVKTLQDEWIGEDEQDYETKLAEKINTLYANAHALVQSACETITGLTTSWHEFQLQNTVDGSVTSSRGEGVAEMPTIPSGDQIVKAKEKTFGANDDRGLKQDSSASTIKTSVETYVNAIKSKSNGLYSEITTEKAFFGEQTSSINQYIVKVGDAIAEITVAIKDLYDALDRLAGTKYVESSSTVSQTFGENANTIEQSVSDLEGRWS